MATDNGKHRSRSGQATMVLVLMIAFFVLLVAGLFSFELNRLEVARQQLRTATEAAALSGAATLASSDNTNPAAAQSGAEDTALNTFQTNSVIGVALASAVQTYANPDQPGADQASLYMELLNPNDNNAVVQIGDPNGKTLRVTSFFGLKPAFGATVGLPVVTVQCTALGGVPQLDLVLCFDISASIDDQTPVTFVKRAWNAGTNKTDYIITSTSSGSPAGSLAQGTIFSILGPPAIGTAVDGTPPQTLLASNQSGIQHPLDFSETGAARGLRGSPNSGSPPGNYPRGGNTGNAQTYTDLVVNIDGNTHFQGTTYNGFSFPDLPTLVEAARGNLENQSVFTSSKANLSVPSNIQPQAGYQQAYLQAAKVNLHPLYDAQQACQTFLNIMNTDCDSHFCLVAFTTNAGTSQTSTQNMPNVDYYYSAGGSSNFSVPMIPLNSTTGATNYSTCYNTLPTLTAVSGTNIGDAINTAVNQLKNNSRKAAKKAIVLFTDGEPTSAGPLSSDPWTNARDAAVAAQKAGIPIYSIGLAQTPAIIPSETQILTDQNSNPSSGGVSGIAGHGGKFFLVTNNADLRKTFENIARQLVQLVR